MVGQIARSPIRQACLRDLRVKVQSKSAKRFSATMPACLRRRAKETIGATRELVLDEQLRELEIGSGAASACATRPGGRLPSREPRCEAGVSCGFMRESPPKVYWVIGRMAGSALRSVGAGRAGVRSTSWRMV